MDPSKIQEKEIPSLKENRIDFWRFSFDERSTPKFLRLTGLMLASFYLFLMRLIEGSNMMHYFFASIIFMLFVGGSKEFIKFWSPFVLLWISYDTYPIFTKNLSNPVNVKEVYDLELLITGWFTKGEVIPFIFQEYRNTHAGEILVNIVDIIAAIFYMSHLVAPIWLGIHVYKNYRGNIEFKRFIFTFIGVSYAGLLTFLIFPAAPPWYVYNKGNGLNFRVPNREDSVKDAAGLVKVDELIGAPFFQTAYESLNSNAYAAVPSIHFAYSLIIAVYAIKIYGKKANIMAVYPVGMAFSAMWLNHHYLVDILWSAVYVIIFYFIGKKLFSERQKFSVENPNEMGLIKIKDTIS